MTTDDKITYLKQNIEPINNRNYGKYYRAAAYLNDGTYLPCVRFFNSKQKVDLAIKRFQEEKSGNSVFYENPEEAYRSIVSSFVVTGDQINEFNIQRIDISPFAFPNHILETIEGETSMSWTGFCAKMSDNSIFSFGTSFLFDFFQMPENYQANDIVEIINHSYLNKSEIVKNHDVPFFEWPEDYDETKILRERVAFDCFIEGL